MIPPLSEVNGPNPAAVDSNHLFPNGDAHMAEKSQALVSCSGKRHDVLGLPGAGHLGPLPALLGPRCDHMWTCCLGRLVGAMLVWESRGDAERQAWAWAGPISRTPCAAPRPHPGSARNFRSCEATLQHPFLGKPGGVHQNGDLF